MPELSSAFVQISLSIVPEPMKHLYERADTKTQRIADISVKAALLIITFAFVMLPALAAIYNIYKGNLDTREWLGLFKIE